MYISDIMSFILNVSHRCILSFGLSSLWLLDFLGGTMVKNLSANSGDARDMGSNPGLEDPWK